MINVPAALDYLARYNVAVQDRTTLGHLREWLSEAIEQHEQWLSCVTGCGAPEVELELSDELTTLRDGLRRVETAGGKNLKGTRNQ